jgi:hypothetical protein
MRTPMAISDKNVGSLIKNIRESAERVEWLET